MTTIAADPDIRTVALIGNPNTGKSTLFGALSGVQQRVGNYPGVTVEKKIGRMSHDGHRWTLIDLPGTYSLAPRSPDEMVAVDVLLGRRQDMPPPDVVLCVVDANNLERNLYLVSQVLELGRPTVVALTMVDVADARGLEIDLERLARQLGVPVVPVQANRRLGLDALKDMLAEAPPAGRPGRRRARSPNRSARRSPASKRSWRRPEPGRTVPRPSALPAPLSGRAAAAGHRRLPRGACPRGRRSGRLRDEIRDGSRAAGRGRPAGARRRGDGPVRLGRRGSSTGSSTGPSERAVTLGDRIDCVLTHRLWGTLILAALMLLVFHSVFSWAEVPMNCHRRRRSAGSPGWSRPTWPRGPCGACWSTASSAGSAPW